MVDGAGDGGGDSDQRDQAAALGTKLATGTWTHDYGITAEEARSLGMRVPTEIVA